MKTILCICSFLVSVSVFANCDEFKVSKAVKKNLEGLVNADLGNGERITKVENINVYTTKDKKGDVIALYTVDETFTSTTGQSSVKNMVGYAKFGARKCNNYEGLSLGSSQERF